MQIPATLTLSSWICPNGSAELHPVEAQDFVCGVLPAAVLGWRYQNCLSADRKWFCPLECNRIWYSAFAQMAQRALVENLEQCWVKFERCYEAF